MPFRLVAQPASIAAGRRWVSAQARLNGVAAVRLPVIALLSSELITNAVLHGPSSGVITVRVLRADGHLRVEVDDESTVPPRLTRPDPTATSGRGMVLVDACATRWGSEARGSAGKTVWFDLAL